jgi:hypothetical protein
VAVLVKVVALKTGFEWSYFIVVSSFDFFILYSLVLIFDNNLIKIKVLPPEAYLLPALLIAGVQITEDTFKKGLNRI